MTAALQLVERGKFLLTDPLGMENTTYHPTPEVLSNMASQYRFVPGDENQEMDYVEAQKFGNAKVGYFKKCTLDVHDTLGPEYDSGGGGIATTAQDYVKLAAALANWGMGLAPRSISTRKSIWRRSTPSIA